MKKNLPKDKIIRAVISLVLAIFLWLTATANTNPTKTMKISNLDITYTNLSETLVIDNPENKVDIKLTGLSSQMNKVSKSDIRAYVDLSNISKSGEYTLEVKISGLPDGVSVSEISSKYLLLKLGNYVSAQADFEIEAIGTLPSSNVLLYLDYDNIDISYTASDNLTQNGISIKGYIDISSKTSSFTKDVYLKAYDQSGNELDYVSIEPSSVEVSAVIGIQKPVSINPILEGECALGYNVLSTTLSKNEVVIAGSAEVINEITSIETLPISIEGKTESFDTDIEFALPEGVHLYDNSEFKAHVQIEKNSTKEFTYSNIQIRNLGQNLTCTFNDFESLSIQLIGQENGLEEISQDDITVYIDLADLSEGDHDVKIQYDMPSNVTISSESQKTVSITLKSE